MSRRRTDVAFLAWAEATEACLALMRAGIRARNPGAKDERVEALLRKRLEQRRRDKLRDYRRNA